MIAASSSGLSCRRFPGVEDRQPRAFRGALPPLYVVSAALFCYGARFYERDRAAVPIAADPPAPARPQHGLL